MTATTAANMGTAREITERSLEIPRQECSLVSSSTDNRVRVTRNNDLSRQPSLPSRAISHHNTMVSSLHSHNTCSSSLCPSSRVIIILNFSRSFSNNQLSSSMGAEAEVQEVEAKAVHRANFRVESLSYARCGGSPTI